jgi:branched-chain amino acid transport system ATP-binding protein
MNSRTPGTTLVSRRSNYRPFIRVEIWRCLKQLKEEGQAILLIDKNLSEMAALVDKHHIVEKGRVVWVGSPTGLGNEPEIARRYLGL